MAVYKEEINNIQSKGTTPTYINITSEVREIIKKSGIKNGVVHVISPHTTCSVFFEEYVHDTMPNGKEFIQQDLDNALAKIIPDPIVYDSQSPLPILYSRVISSGVFFLLNKTVVLPLEVKVNGSAR